MEFLRWTIRHSIPHTSYASFAELQRVRQAFSLVLPTMGSYEFHLI